MPSLWRTVSSMLAGSRRRKLHPARPLSEGEKLLVTEMARGTPFEGHVRQAVDRVLVEDMSDGGMGSVRFCAAGNGKRQFGRQVSEASFLDADRVSSMRMVSRYRPHSTWIRLASCSSWTFGRSITRRCAVTRRPTQSAWLPRQADRWRSPRARERLRRVVRTVSKHLPEHQSTSRSSGGGCRRSGRKSSGGRVPCRKYSSQLRPTGPMTSASSRFTTSVSRFL